MTIGFTGSQHGMTRVQHNVIRTILQNSVSPDPEAHAGDCIGADEEFQKMAWDMGYFMVLHPPEDQKKRAFWLPPTYTRILIHLPKPYMERNQAIVDECNLLIGAPAGLEVSHPRSGTWATIRKAIRAKKPVIIVDWNGDVEHRKR